MPVEAPNKPANKPTVIGNTPRMPAPGLNSLTANQIKPFSRKVDDPTPTSPTSKSMDGLQARSKPSTELPASAQTIDVAVKSSVVESSQPAVKKESVLPSTPRPIISSLPPASSFANPNILPPSREPSLRPILTGAPNTPLLTPQQPTIESLPSQNQAADSKQETIPTTTPHIEIPGSYLNPNALKAAPEELSNIAQSADQNSADLRNSIVQSKGTQNNDVLHETLRASGIHEDSWRGKANLGLVNVIGRGLSAFGLNEKRVKGIQKVLLTDINQLKNTKTPTPTETASTTVTNQDRLNSLRATPLVSPAESPVIQPTQSASVEIASFEPEKSARTVETKETSEQLVLNSIAEILTSNMSPEEQLNAILKALNVSPETNSAATSNGGNIPPSLPPSLPKVANPRENSNNLEIEASPELPELPVGTYSQSFENILLQRSFMENPELKDAYYQKVFAIKSLTESPQDIATMIGLPIDGLNKDQVDELVTSELLEVVIAGSMKPNGFFETLTNSPSKIDTAANELAAKTEDPELQTLITRGLKNREVIQAAEGVHNQIPSKNDNTHTELAATVQHEIMNSRDQNGIYLMQTLAQQFPAQFNVGEDGGLMTVTLDEFLRLDLNSNRAISEEVGAQLNKDLGFKAWNRYVLELYANRK